MASKSNKNGLSTKQLKAIEMLMDYDEDYTKKRIAELLDINNATLYKWLKKPEFVEELNRKSEEFFKSSNFQVNKELLKKIKKGDTSAMRLYYEKLNDFKQKHEIDGKFKSNIIADINPAEFSKEAVEEIVKRIRKRREDS